MKLLNFFITEYKIRTIYYLTKLKKNYNINISSLKFLSIRNTDRT